MDIKLVYLGKWVIDRFEEDSAVLESTTTLETIALPKADLPKEANPGDTLFMQDGEWQFDHEETEARRKRIQERFRRIKERVRQERP